MGQAGTSPKTLILLSFFFNLFLGVAVNNAKLEIVTLILYEKNWHFLGLPLWRQPCDFFG